MSATKPQEEELPFSNEPITAESIEMLRHFAWKTCINLDEASEQMFGKPVQQLTRGQVGKVLVMLLEVLGKQRASKHRHYCVECGDTVNCSTPNCSDTEDLCYRCRKGEYEPTPPRRILYKPRPKPIFVIKCRRQ